MILEKGKWYLLTKRLFCYKLDAPKTLVLLQNVIRNQVCRVHKSQQSVVEIGRGINEAQMLNDKEEIVFLYLNNLTLEVLNLF